MISPGKRKYLLYGIQLLFAGAILLFLLLTVDFKTLFLLILQINPGFLIIAALFYLGNNVIMAWRLKRILYSLGEKIRFKNVFYSHMSGMLLSDVTPARGGYLYVGIALSRQGVPHEKGIAAITSTYLFDLLFKIGIALFGLYYLYSSIINGWFNASFLFVIGVIIIVMAGYFVIAYPPAIIQPYAQRNKIFETLLAYGRQSRSLHRKVPLILSVSLVGWVFRGFEWLFIALSIGKLTLSLTDALFLNPVLTLLSLVPLSPGGIGFQEAGIVGALVLLGIGATIALSFALIVRVLEIFVDLIGLRGVLQLSYKTDELRRYYNSIDGDIDEKAFNSDLLVQRDFQKRKTSTIVEMLANRDMGVLLDIGCGSGVQLKELTTGSYTCAIGLDVSRNALLCAKSRNPERTEFVIADAEHLPFRDASIDTIVSAEIIEHLPHPELLVNDLCRILKPGGELVITTPNEHSIWGIYEFLWDVFGRGRNYGNTHLKFFSPGELRSMFKEFSEQKTITLFFFSPFLALFNSERVLSYGKRFDRFFEDRGLGVSLVLWARK